MWEIEGALSTIPEHVGQPTGQPGIFGAAIPGNLVVPALIIYYAFDDATVVLASI